MRSGFAMGLMSITEAESRCFRPKPMSIFGCVQKLVGGR